MLLKPQGRVRNIGVIAHIDAGKTTTTERFLYFAGVTHKLGEVHDGEAVMDFRSDERERGITISAAATTFLWREHQINLIDTPGHVDFTAEVERSMRVLDGAVVVFSAVEGVEPQSETVWRQADRYGVPRIALINKMDRVGADHQRVLGEIATKLDANPVAVNVPVGSAERFLGVVDLISMSLVPPDDHAADSDPVSREIPSEMLESARAARDVLVERIAESVDRLAELYLAEKEITEEDLISGLREATLAGDVVPVLCGAALRDLGISPVLDAVCRYLPSPSERPPAIGQLPGKDELRSRRPSFDEPFSALVFKVVAAPNADFFWLRVYSGRLRPDDRCLNPRTGVRLRLRRMLRLHADRTESVENAECGDIIAVPALKDVVTGDTLCAPDHPIAFEPIQFPETVVSVAVEARTSSDLTKLLEVVDRLRREDPTFQSHTDEETGELILSGMGELHLDVLRNRMLREFNVEARFGRPRVSYRETIKEPAKGRGVFDKRIGDVSVSARAALIVEPRPRERGDHSVPMVGVDLGPVAATMPSQLRADAVDILRTGCEAGGEFGYPVVDVNVRVVTLELGDAPDPLIPMGAVLSLAMRDALKRARSIVLEPVMRFEVRAPEGSLGAVVKDLGARRAEIRETGVVGTFAFVRGRVPLAEMFGYSTQVRSLTQGRGSFSLEPHDLGPLPESLAQRDHFLG